MQLDPRAASGPVLQSPWRPRIALKPKGHAANSLSVDAPVLPLSPRPLPFLPVHAELSDAHAPRLRSIADNMGRAFPKLEMLVLTNNRFATLKELEPLASLQTLIHLSLVDNPVRCGSAGRQPTSLCCRCCCFSSSSSSSPRPPTGSTWRHGLPPRAAGDALAGPPPGPHVICHARHGARRWPRFGQTLRRPGSACLARPQAARATRGEGRGAGVARLAEGTPRARGLQRFIRPAHRARVRR